MLSLLPALALLSSQVDTTAAISGRAASSPFWDFDFDNIAVDGVGGIEVYRDAPLGSPFGFAQRSLAEGARDPRTYEPFQRRGSCGSIQIWTKR